MESSNTTPSQALNRSEAFHPTDEPLRHESALKLQKSHVSGPISFLNPTKARFRHDARPDVRFKWTSRNNRKGRHAVVIHQSDEATSSKPVAGTTPRPTASTRGVAQGIWRMLTYYPFWDISFDVAFVFTVGSVIWVVNAFFVWLPLVSPSTEFESEELDGGGITAFVGATVFEVGSLLLLLEAVNENRSGCFGWALEQVVSREEEHAGSATPALRPSKSHCAHHHQNKRNLVGKGRRRGSSSSLSPSSKHQGTTEGETSTTTYPSWIWLPTSLSHRLHSLSFLASLTQLLAASIFWVAGLTSLPGIYNHMSPTITIVFYWTPQIIGGLGFILSGTLFMLETQSHWYKPAPGTLGWWVGAWNLVGGVGFTLCPAFGYDSASNSWAQYQACLSTFWGSWAFLVGSVLQWYESLDKFPVEVVREGHDSTNGGSSARDTDGEK